MVRRLPPLSALRVFEAAARHESFTKAAEELAMSQASVSYQVKVLEERIGSPLFLRRPRKVTLTREGQRLARPTVDAFDRLRAAYDNVGSTGEGTLSISTSPTFAGNWLASRIGRFQIAHPNLAVRVETEGHNVDFAREEIDVAIRYGRGKWEGLLAHKLMASQFAPMLSPTLMKIAGNGEFSILDMLSLRLIDPQDPYWQIWLQQAGHPADDLSERVGSHLGSQTNEARAAISGLGVAMLSPRFFHYELATGQLVQPFELIGSDGQGYWLVYPEARRLVPKIATFRKWIEAEASSDADPVVNGQS